MFETKIKKEKNGKSRILLQLKCWFSRLLYTRSIKYTHHDHSEFIHSLNLHIPIYTFYTHTRITSHSKVTALNQMLKEKIATVPGEDGEKLYFKKTKTGKIDKLRIKRNVVGVPYSTVERSQN